MIADEINKLPPGPDLDNLFFDCVMKYRTRPAVMAPSRILGDAWLGLEELQRADDGRIDKLDSYLGALGNISPLYALKEKEAALVITRACVIVSLQDGE